MIKQIRKKREKKIKKRKVAIRNASFLMDFCVPGMGHN